MKRATNTRMIAEWKLSDKCENNMSAWWICMVKCMSVYLTQICMLILYWINNSIYLYQFSNSTNEFCTLTIRGRRKELLKLHANEKQESKSTPLFILWWCVLFSFRLLSFWSKIEIGIKTLFVSTVVHSLALFGSIICNSISRRKRVIREQVMWVKPTIYCESWCELHVTFS